MRKNRDSIDVTPVDSNIHDNSKDHKIFEKTIEYSNRQRSVEMVVGHVKIPYLCRKGHRHVEFED
jgi:hypothetical protein